MEWTPIVDCAYSATITVGTTASNKAKVTVQLKDFEGNNLTVAANVIIRVSDVATGLTTPGTAIGSEVAVNTDGELSATILTKVAFLMTSTATGLFDVDLEDTSNKSTFYLVVVMPNGKLEVSGAVDLGD